MDDQPAGSAEPDIASHRRTQVESAQPTYLVGRHDTLWQIAEITLGDGRRWQEIRDQNIGRTMVDGHRITEATDRLTPGWLLILPDGAQIPEETEDTQDQTLTEVTVERGDNFWTIAEKALEKAWGRAPSDRETAHYWRQLVDNNLHRLLPPHDPNLIYPDQRFELPPLPAVPDGEESTEKADPKPSDYQELKEVTVERGDNLWSIAQGALADAWERTPASIETADYWHHVMDANRDHLLPPHDPNLIYPGQVLHLPPVPNDPQVSADVNTGAAATPLPREPAAPPSIEPGAGTETPTLEVPPTTTAPTGNADVPHVIRESARPEPNPAQQSPTDTVNPHQAPDLTDQTTATGPGDDADDENLPGELFPLASTLAGLGVLAAGLVALLHRLRNTQLRRRRPGTIPTQAAPDTTKTEAAIRSAAAPTSTEFIDLALRAMAHDVTADHIPPPEVVGANLTPETLRILLWTPHHNPPPGWRVDDDGRSWTMSTDTALDLLRRHADGIPAPYPALVTVGHGDQTQLLLDLEYLGATQLTGDPEDVAATCYTMATELAASPIAESIQVICVGFGHDLTNLERIRVVDHLNEILPAVAAKAAAISHLQSASPLQGRLSAVGGDTWDPIIVFDPTVNASDEARRLLATAHAGRGVAAVVGYPTGDRWRFHIEKDTVHIEPLDYTFARRNLTPTEQTAVADLVAAAKDLEGMPVELVTDPVNLNEPIDEAPPSTEQLVEQSLFEDSQTPTRDASTSPIPEVKVLGTLRIDGPETRFPLRKCTELITYLTFHRNGVEADTLMEALWPEQPPDYPRLNRHTSRTRTTLGHGPDAEPYLPYVRDGIYRISPQVRSDLDEFTSHIREADRAARGEEVDHLYAALELVEGTPFTGAGNGYTWAHTDGIITHTIVAVDDAAHHLAQIALDNDTPDQATWAARKGLTATGACEQCYRNLMHATIAEGNQVAFEAVYAELLAVVDADEGPDASSFLDPETIELYEQQSRKRRRHVG
ncbi:MAG: LysM peptidoglycan-binding domain-containing protein [Acidobacteria bacterium]|nr:LysM peptidoglycan-binding domain-containing protein [Acidobacteriota bacterium]